MDTLYKECESARGAAAWTASASRLGVDDIRACLSIGFLPSDEAGHVPTQSAQRGKDNACVVRLSRQLLNFQTGSRQSALSRPYESRFSVTCRDSIHDVRQQNRDSLKLVTQVASTNLGAMLHSILLMGFRGVD
jgi:hypothetical protein